MMEIKFKETKKKETKEMGMDEFISYLMVCRNVLHAMHLKTTSYAEHKALNEFYDSLVEHIDNISEVYQGYYGKLLNLKFETGNEYLNLKPVEYVAQILKHVEQCKSKYQDNSMILNEIDNLVKDLSKSLYLLKFLQ